MAKNENKVLPMKITDPDTGEEITRPSSDDAPLSALVFKIMTDPFVGKLAFIRVYSGKIVSGEGVYNPSSHKHERIGRLLKMHANHRAEVQEILAGDIAARRARCDGCLRPSPRQNCHGAVGARYGHAVHHCGGSRWQAPRPPSRYCRLGCSDARPVAGASAQPLA